MYATIKINRDNNILVVKKISRRKDGNGITIMTIKTKIPKGKAKDLSLLIAKTAANILSCQIHDITLLNLFNKNIYLKSQYL